MNLIAFLKASVAVMTILLFAGFTFIIYKLSDKETQSKLKTKNIVQNEQQSDFNSSVLLQKTEKNNLLQADEDIFSVLACGENICLTVKNKTDNYRLIVFQPQSGMIVNEMLLK